MIVNVSSYVGIRGDAANGVYAISKFGLEAWSESLSKEVEEFGISVLVPEFGAFRTKFLDHDVFNQPSKDIVPGYEGSFAESTFDGIKRAQQKQPGDPAKGVEHLFQIILEGGKLNGQKLFRIPIGADAVQVVEDKVARVAADLGIARALEENHSTLF
jgi:short-subunit dehydrogenase